MKSLVIAEPGDTVKPATLSTLTAALKATERADLVLFGDPLSPALKAYAHCPKVDKVFIIPSPKFLSAEAMIPTLENLAKDYSHIFAAATTFGKNFLPRLAARLDVGQISDLTEVLSPRKFKRPIYAGNALMTLETEDSIVIATIRPTAFAPAELEASEQAQVLELPLAPSHLSDKVTILQQTTPPQTRPDLSSAKVVVSGGRGVGSLEKFALIEQLADCLQGAVGASRAAVDAGFAPNDAQIGQTGKVVAPQLYFAIGLSGALQHLAGMKDSKVIVAINKDPEAPICQIADYTLVADLFEALPQLIAALKEPLHG